MGYNLRLDFGFELTNPELVYHTLIQGWGLQIRPHILIPSFIVTG